MSGDFQDIGRQSFSYQGNGVLNVVTRCPILSFKPFPFVNHKQSHYISIIQGVFIGPESDHWLCLSLTNSLTDCPLVNLIDVTLACEDGYSKLVEGGTVADVDDEDRVGNSLLQIWLLRFGHRAKVEVKVVSCSTK